MFETAIPCIVELMGHNRIAGMVSEQELAGAKLVRVDVPAADDQPAYTKLFGTPAIYAVTPVDEATMLQAVRAFRAVPIERWALQVTTRTAITSGSDEDDDDDDIRSRF